jgi:23S rRNA pseudouridine1911/1915/1917 synthase
MYHETIMRTKQGEEWQVLPADADQRLDKWLAAPERLGSRSKALQAIERGKVFIDDLEQGTNDSSRKVVTGERIRVWHDRPGSATKRYFERHDSGLHIIYEDQSLIVINKPAGLLTVPLATQPGEPSLFDQVQNHLRSARKMTLLVVHRIDRDTSGLVVFAKTPSSLSNLKDQFERRQPERTYLAFVCGVPLEDAGSWNDMLVWDQDELRQKPFSPGKPSQTAPAKPATLHWKVVERFERASLLEIRLVTGKRNQIRIQAALHHHPLIGERMYRDGMPVDSLINFTRQALHAWKLALEHPITKQKLKFEAPLPADLQTLQARLETPSKPLDHLTRDIPRRPVKVDLLPRSPKRRDRRTT